MTTTNYNILLAVAKVAAKPDFYYRDRNKLKS